MRKRAATYGVLMAACFATRAQAQPFGVTVPSATTSTTPAATRAPEPRRWFGLEAGLGAGMPGGLVSIGGVFRFGRTVAISSGVGASIDGPQFYAGARATPIVIDRDVRLGLGLHWSTGSYATRTLSAPSQEYYLRRAHWVSGEVFVAAWAFGRVELRPLLGIGVVANSPDAVCDMGGSLTGQPCQRRVLWVPYLGLAGAIDLF